MISTRIREDIEAGIALLDANRPGWYRDVDLEILDLASSRRCVVGQLYGTYSHGVAELGLHLGSRFGFAMPASLSNMNNRLYWKDLNEAWTQEIQMRLMEDELEEASEIGVKTEEELCAPAL